MNEATANALRTSLEAQIQQVESALSQNAGQSNYHSEQLNALDDELLALTNKHTDLCSMLDDLNNEPID
jgi:chromosome segregation ATPase